MVRSAGVSAQLMAKEGAYALVRLPSGELPDDTSDGPHFFYGLQWWFFGALAIFGFFYLAWDEAKQRREQRRGQRRIRDRQPSERPEHATVHGQHHPGDER